MKKIAKFLLVFVVIGLTLLFLRWNWWQIRKSIFMTKKIYSHPAAFNLIIKDGNSNSILYKKSFAWNSAGKFYIINQFDIGLYINGSGDNQNYSKKPNGITIKKASPQVLNLNLNIVVNGQTINPILIKRERIYNIIICRDFRLIFTTPACKIDEFLHLIRSSASVDRTLI